MIIMELLGYAALFGLGCVVLAYLLEGMVGTGFYKIDPLAAILVPLGVALACMACMGTIIGLVYLIG